MNPLISVILPIYKVEDYLSRCLESVVNQTYQNLEIILVDDGSPDKCPAICDDWAKRDPRIRVIHKENGGVSAARNAGLDIMQGECLMFVDPDDWMTPDAVEALYDRLVQDNSDMVIGQMVKIYDDGHTEQSRYAWMKDSVITGMDALALLGKEQTLSCTAWGKLIKRSVYEELRFPAIYRAEDMWLFPHILENCRTISLESRVLYFYYQRPTSIVHTSKDQNWLDCATAAFHVSQFLLARKLRENASVYCLSGLLQLQNVQNVKESRKLVVDTFSWRIWMKLSQNSPKCWLYGCYLYMPNVYKMLQRMWQKIK